MNKYVRAAVYVPFGTVKICCIKIFHPKSFSAKFLNLISPLTEIALERNASLKIGKLFKMHTGAKICVRSGECRIGNHVFMGNNSRVICRENVVIGDEVMLSPNVQIYDHDHDYKAQGGISSLKYKTGSVIIGNNVWIGANTVILRGSRIGDNCVIGAGSIIKGEVPANSVFIQKRDMKIERIKN